MNPLTGDADTIQLVSSEDAPRSVTFGGHIYNNIIVVKSTSLGIEPKVIVVQTLNRKLSKEEINAIIVRERAKLVAAKTVTDVSNNTESVTDCSDGTQTITASDHINASSGSGGGSCGGSCGSCDSCGGSCGSCGDHQTETRA
jgi:hypothetical protein